MHCALIVDESSARLWNEDEQKELGRIELDHDAYSRLQEINTRYAACTNSGDAVKLLQVGKDLYEWLDNGTGGAFTRLVDSCQGKLVFEVRGNKVRNFGDKVWAVLNAPWEVLANGQGFLALDAILGFAPCRRLGAPGAQRELSPWRLGVLFMAAAPTGAQELDHEKEELGIIQAVGHRTWIWWWRRAGIRNYWPNACGTLMPCRWCTCPATDTMPGKRMEPMLRFQRCFWKMNTVMHSQPRQSGLCIYSGISTFRAYCSCPPA